MRKDMSKKLCERPRYGGYATKPRPKNPHDFDSLPKREGIRHRWNRTYNRKYLSENFAPFLRFLRSKVGQPWNDVYSEICEGIRKNDKATDYHVWQHLIGEGASGWISFDIVMQDGIPHNPTWGSRNNGVYGFYVHPDSGILCYRAGPGFKFTPSSGYLNKVKLTDTEWLVEFKDIWYKVEVERPGMQYFYPHREEDKSGWDALHKEYISWNQARDAYGVVAYVKKKKQLSKREKKKYGVK